MFHSRKFAVTVVAGLILCFGVSLATPTTAQANNGGSGQLAAIYSVTVTYTCAHGQTHVFGRYFATKYPNGSIDWGGADYGAQSCRAQFGNSYRSWRFWRLTLNG